MARGTSNLAQGEGNIVNHYEYHCQKCGEWVYPGHGEPGNEDCRPTDVQRAIERQAKLEAEATAGPWGHEYGMVCHTSPKLRVITGDAGEPDSRLIAHLRNQAKLARDVIEAAAEVRKAIEQMLQYRYIDAEHPRKDAVDRVGATSDECDSAIQVWADYVNGEEKP